jgi:hypothetical protein
LIEQLGADRAKHGCFNRPHGHRGGNFWGMYDCLQS